MKLFNKQAFRANLELLGGTKDLYIFAFAGTLPANAQEIPFNINDPVEIINNSIGGCRANDESFEPGVERYNFTGVTVPSVGYAESIESPGFYRVAPAAIDCSENLKSIGAYLSDFLTTSNTSAQSKSMTEIDLNEVVNDWLEFDFGADITLDKISIAASKDSRYVPTSLIIQKFEADAWVDHETISMASTIVLEQRSEYDLAVPVTGQKIRIRFGNKPGSGLYPMGFEFYTATEPTAVVSTPDDISWFLLVPPGDGVEFLRYPTLGKRLPALWGTAGGPNEEQAVAFSSESTVPGNFLKLLNLKLRSLAVGALK
jgi:hypothetical protein